MARKTQGMEARLNTLKARRAEGQALLRAGVPRAEVATRMGVAPRTVQDWQTDIRNAYVPEPVAPVKTPRLWSQAERETPMGEWGKP